MTKIRIKVIQLIIPLLASLIIARLFYWQVVRADFLTSRASSQYEQTVTLQAKRGGIYSTDGSVLAGTDENYLLYAYKPQLNRSPQEISHTVAPIITSPPPATASGIDLVRLQQNSIAQTQSFILDRLNQDSSWVAIKHHLSRDQKEAIEALNLAGLGFDIELVRYYPESSMSAQMLGFVGKDINGQARGYFGLEGYYDRELQGQPGKVEQEMDAWGNPILVGNFSEFDSKNGRDLLTTINRSVQYQVEKLLKDGLLRYQAISGTVIVMEPKSGAIIAMASFPNYNPAIFYQFPAEHYKNPAVADVFEPGSIFKPLVMAAALDAGAIEPETQCDICAGPIHIGSYTIGTWNNEYHPNTTMTETIIHSDNTGMVFATRRLGKDKLHDYLANFGLGKKTGVDLEDETTGELRSSADWHEIDAATIAFGQGIALTPIQIITAINTIANHGVWVQPYITQTISDGSKVISIAPNKSRRVLGEAATDQITQMMVAAIEEGDAKWAKPKDMSIAGKTGTAQIPVAGHYDAEKTIASFVGFSPAADPKFSMIVSLREPQTSQWGSETAAPLWFSIARQISLLL